MQITGFDILIVDLILIQCLPFDKQNNIENLPAFSGTGNRISRRYKLQYLLVTVHILVEKSMGQYVMARIL